jgi:hypothetical protein
VAVFEGARPRGLGRPRSAAPALDLPLSRRRVRSALRSGQRSNHLTLLLGSIIVAFVLGFFSLAQQMRVSATSIDIGRLSLERQRLDARADDVRSDLDRLGREPAIRKISIGEGLGQLAEPIVLPAR